MIFNFTKKNQFTTSLSVDDQSVEVVKETKLLGTHITQDLKWNKNTAEIVKKAWQRMQLLNKASGFTSNIWDLKQIFQKVAIKVILGKKYTSYKAGLKTQFRKSK